MAKQALTSAGVKAKTAELYALSNADLQTQANLITTDFRTWIANNFALTTPQASYLASIDAAFLKYSGNIVGTAVNHRLPVSLVNPNPPSVYSSKYAAIQDLLVPIYDSLGGFTVSGSVGFNIGYR